MPNITYTPPYTGTGPWVNGGAPGISQSFLNNIEGWVEQVDNPVAVVATGSVSGNATLYQPLTGPFAKQLMVVWTNYKSAAAQTLLLTAPFAFGGLFFVGETQAQTVEFLLSGVAQNCSIVNSVASSGGAQLPGTLVKSWSFGMTRAGFDTIRLTFTTTAAGGIMTVWGY